MDQNRLILFHNVFMIIFTLTAFLLSLYRCENELFKHVSCFHFIFSICILAIFCCKRKGIAIFLVNSRNEWEWVRNTDKSIFMIQLLTQFQHLFYSSTPLSESVDCALLMLLAKGADELLALHSSGHCTITDCAFERKHSNRIVFGKKWILITLSEIHSPKHNLHNYNGTIINRKF